MKFICLGYIQPGKFENMAENERHAMLDECFDYDDKLREKRHFSAGEALQPPDAARTLHWKNGKVVVTDGPYAETKEQLAGILVLEARDLTRFSLSLNILRSSMDLGRSVLQRSSTKRCRRANPDEERLLRQQREAIRDKFFPKQRKQL